MSDFGVFITIIAGVLSIGLGIRALKRGFTFVTMEMQFRREVYRWQVFGQSNPTPQLIEAVKRNWCYLRAVSLIGGGLGLLLLAGIDSVISLAITGSIGDFGTGDGILAGAIMYSALVIGLGVGSIFAVWRLRKATRRHLTYADLRQRRLSDYRDRLFRWLPGIILVETLALSALFAPHLGPTLSLIAASGDLVHITYTPWLLAIAPACMVVISLVAEFLMSHIAHSPRLLVTPDPAVSQRADDMLRATAIGMILLYQVMTVAFLALMQDNWIIRGLWDSGFWNGGNRPYDLVASLFFLLIMATACAVALIVARRERRQQQQMSQSAQMQQRQQHEIQP